MKSFLQKKTSVEVCNCKVSHFKSKSAVELSHHVRLNHVKDQVSQTATPKKTKEKKDIETTCPCFYCGYKISCNAELLTHKIKCHEPEVMLRDNPQIRQPKLLPLPMPSFNNPIFPISTFPIPPFQPFFTIPTDFN